MKTVLSLLTFFSLFTTAVAQEARTEVFTLTPAERAEEIVVKRIALENYAPPVITIAHAAYADGNNQATDAGSTPTPLTVVMGMERKQPFALVKIPTMKAGVVGRLQQVTLSVKEAAGAGILPAAKTTASSSVLATGDWYKLAVPDRGLYRIDYAFLSSTLGISGAISSSAIRLYGNGGAMLSEAVGAPRTDDLGEVAVQIQDGGDGTFGAGDYLVFYAPGHNSWRWNGAAGRYEHTKNLYEDRSFYFLTVGGNGKRVADQSGVPAANVAVNSFDEYTLLNEDKVNPGSFGRRWFGDEFGSAPGKELARSYTLPTPGVIDSLRSRVAYSVGNTQSTDVLSFSFNGTPASAHAFSTGSAATDIPYGAALWTDARPFSGGQVTFDFSFSASSSASRGYLDFIELNWRRALQYAGAPLHFRDVRSAGAGRVAGYQIGGAGGSIQVWDVTEAGTPVRMNSSVSGSTRSFSREAEGAREFVAFEAGSVTTAPSYAGRISNQNLHGEGQQDYLIVTNNAFKSAAENLAAFHREKRGLRVLVATVDQIYNEFSSGSQDISAIRDFARMFYDRAGTDAAQMPRYLLMFGDASYDYKDRVASNTNYVPTFEGSVSDTHLLTFAGDDFFAMLDDSEDINSEVVFNTLDVGIARLPVKNSAEANAMVEKIKRYASPASLGPWRISTTYIGDNEDGAGAHLMDAEAAANAVDTASSIYNSSKVYLDNLAFVSTPGGTRCPDANKMINDGVFRGTFLINYSGHGGPATLAHERVVTADDFNAWNNGNKMPIMLTATCDFATFDQPAFVSAGEKLILKSDGGSIAMLTTTHAVYAGQSGELNTNFLEDQLRKAPDGTVAAFGDALRHGKNQTYSVLKGTGNLLNFRKYILLGDPALLPAIPQDVVRTDSVVDMATGLAHDTLKALGGYTVHGSVREAVSGAAMSGFNGRVYVTIYDKPRVISLKTKEFGTPRTYQVRSNIVYKGITTAQNGAFSFSFVAPKDLNYEYGAGRISYYAENGATDAAGTDTALKVGGFSDQPVAENNPPSVRPYMNDSLFRNGGLTGSNTVLYVVLEDETGINVSGNAVGHDMTAVLDGAVQDPFVLNDYYETAPNTYRRGFVRFPVTGLSDGTHSLRVKAWDVNNNSGEGTVNFEVAGGAVTRVQSLMCYPNPFRNQTRFVWEHNHSDQVVRAEIHIFSTAGTMVRRIAQDFTPTGSRTAEVTWDGTADGGSALPPGVYLYRLVFTGPAGVSASAYEKVVLLR